MYLSDEWFEAVETALSAQSITSSALVPASFSYAITDLPAEHPRAGSTVHYRLTLDPTSGAATLDRSGDPGDVRFTMTYTTALDVARGAVGGSRSFLNGDVRIGGDIALLIERSTELTTLNLPSLPDRNDA